MKKACIRRRCTGERRDGKVEGPQGRDKGTRHRQRTVEINQKGGGRNEGNEKKTIRGKWKDQEQRRSWGERGEYKRGRWIDPKVEKHMGTVEEEYDEG